MRLGLLGILILLAPNVAFAQTSVASERTPPNNQVSIHPVMSLLGFLKFDYERKFADAWTGYVSPTVFIPILGNMEDDSRGASYFRLRGLGVETGVRFYAFGEGMRGFFIQPSVNYARLSVSIRTENSHDLRAMSNMIGGEAQVGWQWLIRQRAAIRLSAGGGYQHFFGKDFEIDESQEKFNLGGVLPAADFSVGVAF